MERQRGGGGRGNGSGGAAGAVVQRAPGKSTLTGELQRRMADRAPAAAAPAAHARSADGEAFGSGAAVQARGEIEETIATGAGPTENKLRAEHGLGVRKGHRLTDTR